MATAPTKFCTLSLHDALPISFGTRDESLLRTIPKKEFPPGVKVGGQLEGRTDDGQPHVFHVMKIKGDTVHLEDRKSTRLNSSHVEISYAVFCLKKKNALHALT